MNYLYDSPTVAGYCEPPKGRSGTYLSILDAIPDGQAAMLEFESIDHLRSAQNVIPILAHRRDPACKWKTKRVNVRTGKPTLMIWRVTE